eukprot:2920486-Karenia_brevis.AAC.1
MAGLLTAGTDNTWKDIFGVYDIARHKKNVRKVFCSFPFRGRSRSSCASTLHGCQPELTSALRVGAARSSCIAPASHRPHIFSTAAHK